MLETREFIATGSTMSLKDVIDDVFLSSSVTEQGKLKIEAENAEFYKGIILNCSVQYSAESVIEAANTVMASYLRNKYSVDLIVPELSGSRRIPTIDELDAIISGSVYREIIREFSGSIDDWWTKKWQTVSGSAITPEEVDKISRHTWDTKWSEISGNIINTGSFPIHWNRNWKGVSGSLVSVTKFTELFDSGINTKQIWSGNQIEDWVNDQHFLVTGSVAFKNGILDTISSSGYPTHDPIDYFIDQVSQSGQYLKSSEFNLILASHSLYVASASKHTIDYAASTSLQTISASRNDVRTETSASRYVMEQTRLAVLADVQTTISQSVVGEVQAAITQLQTSLAAAQTDISDVRNLVQEVSASIVTQSLDMPDWRNIDGWVQNDGTAFIDLDYESTKGWVLKAVVQPESRFPNPNYIIGRRTSNNGHIDGIALTGGTSSLVDVSSWFGDNPDKITVATQAINLNDKNGLEIKNTEGQQLIAVNGQEFATNRFSGDMAVKGTLYLMAAHSDQGANVVGQNIKYVSVKIYSDKGNLVRELYPAFDRDSNEACMYDYVSKTYFKNAAGSGKFEVSDNVKTAWNA